MEDSILDCYYAQYWNEVLSNLRINWPSHKTRNTVLPRMEEKNYFNKQQLYRGARAEPSISTHVSRYRNYLTNYLKLNVTQS